MPLRVVSLALVAIFAAACAKSAAIAPAQPIGESTVGAASGGARDAGAAVVNGSVDGYIAGDGSGPCGADLPVIAFDPTSADVAPAQAEELQRLAACLSAAPFEKASIVLVGYTDVMGTVPSNLALGLARAQSVMRELMAHGIAPGRIVVATAGELQRPSAHWGLAAPRVEVLVARGGPVRPNEAPVARGVDADGLVPRQPRVAPTAAPAATTRPARQNASASGTSVRR